MSKMQSPYQAFPIHENTFVGTASNVTMDVRPNYLLHAIEDTDVSITLVGGTVLNITGVRGWMDIVLPSNTESVSTTGQVWIS